MNQWGEIMKVVVFEADDFEDDYKRNGLEMLFYWRAKFPKFKITLFTIPGKTSKEMLSLIDRNSDWIELAVHGFYHHSNFECWEWSYDKTKDLMHRVYKMQPERALGAPYYKKIFKAPGWTITDKCSGYNADETLPIHNDPQGVYRALRDMNFVVFDRHYDKAARPEGLDVVCVDCNEIIVHGHTWDMITGDLAGKNGFRQVEELHGVPWDDNTQFYFVSEAWEKGLFQPCQT